jgi:hypothetical protein
MTTALIVLLVLIVLGVIGGIVSYNRFVSQKNLIRDAWANIDTELRRRYDLIPNLVETVKGYATHEREVFENVTKARWRRRRRARPPSRPPPRARSSPRCGSCSPSPRTTRT